MKNTRRSPFAAAAVIAIGLMLSGAGYAAASTAINNSPKSEVASAAQIEEGKKLFLSNCASCHGVNGVGTKVAPTLIGVGAAAAEFQVDSGRMPGQASGPQLQVKKKQFTDEQIDALVAYATTLGNGPDVPTEEMIAANGDATRGGELFRINCAMCHNAVGAGGALVDVSSYARLTDGVERRWGQDDQFYAASPGTFSFVLDNADGRFTPENASSPLATTLTEGMAASLQIGTRLTGGTVRTIEPAFPGGDAAWASVRVTCEDALGELARTRLLSATQSAALQLNRRPVQSAAVAWASLTRL